jgi:hypothetical protein
VDRSEGRIRSGYHFFIVLRDPSIPLGHALSDLAAAFLVDEIIEGGTYGIRLRAESPGTHEAVEGGRELVWYANRYLLRHVQSIPAYPRK